jgi:predicted anti-sigma-YlaC factor YlaD
MKCKKIESFIYVYNELDEKVRSQVNEHLEGCLSCKALFVEISHQQSLIRAVAEMPVFAASPERITRNIMQAIETSNESWFNKVVSILSTYWLRASLAVASVLLAGFFFAELSTDYSGTVINSSNTASNNIKLNTSRFLKAQVKRRESTNQISFYDCLKQPDCDLLKNHKTNKAL